MPPVRDILIVPTDHRYTDHPDWETHPPAGWDAPVDLGDGITIERLTADEAEALFNAAEPAGQNFSSTRQFSQLYSFVREIDEAEYAETHNNWDATNVLATTVALSRLVIDNAYCSEFAGRVIELGDGRGESASHQFSASSSALRTAYATPVSG